jgi:hypothetical protein
MSAETESRGPARPAPELDVEQEVDFGRYWHTLVLRWWLPAAGILAGAILGYLVSLGGSTQYKATAQVYLGQPLAPGAGASVSSVPTQLGLATNLLAGEGTIRQAAARVGLRPSQLRGNVTTEPIIGITGAKVGTPAPLLDVTVTGASAAKTARAANALALIAVDSSSTYQDEKIRQIGERFAFVSRELEKVNRNIDRASRELEILLGSRSLGTAERLLSVSSLNSVLNFNQARQSSLEQERFAMRQLLKLAEDIERGRIVERAVATKAAGPSRRTTVLIGALIGLILGIIAALVWDPLTTRLRPQPE